MAKKQQKTKTIKNKNFLLTCFASLIISLWLCAGLLIAGIEYTAANKIKAQAETDQAELLSGSIIQQVSHDLASTQQRLENISQNQKIQKHLQAYQSARSQAQRLTNSTEDKMQAQLAMQESMQQLKQLSLLLQSSFPNADHLYILPWGQSGTAGIKSTGITLRNNIEALLVAKAGKKLIPTAEAYQEDKKWYVAFTTPIIIDKENVGVILLSVNSDYIAKAIDTPLFKASGKVILKQKKNTQAIIQIGNSNSQKAYSFDIPLSQSEVVIYLNETVNESNAEAIQSIYIIVIALTILLNVIVTFSYIRIKSALKNDIHELQLYANSLSGLHQTKPPQLKMTGLSNVALAIEKAAATPEKHSVVTSTDDDAMAKTMANIAKAKSQTTEDDIIVELSESFGDELNLDDEPELDVDLDLSGEMGDLSTTPAVSAVHNQSGVNKDIFRDYDIRGHAEKQLDDKTVYQIGQAIASEAIFQGHDKIAVAIDGRLSGPRLKDILCKGILSTGCNVIDIGITPTPVLYYAAQKLDTRAGIMITGSHNAPEFNGFKIVLDNKSLYGEHIQKLAQRIDANEFNEGQGTLTQADVNNDYADEICMDIIAARPLKVVIDAGNGVGGDLAVKILQQIDCEVIPLHCEIDGTFPNHAPDPSQKANLADLISAVAEHGADVGIALDGDADRMVAVSNSGQVIAGDDLLTIFAQDVVSRNPAASVVFDVKCSRNLNSNITKMGGRPVMWKSGHSNIKAKMLETSAVLGGEYTGHFFFKERWYGFDDGIYAALRFIELLTIDNRNVDERIAEFPTAFSTEELLLPVADDKEKFNIMLALKSKLHTDDGTLTDIDGIRIDFPDGWGLIRASNTSAQITARFEADSEYELERIRELFQKALHSIDNNLQLPA